MTLVKTSLLNGIAVLIKMLTLLGINKILAIYVGPAGYAAIGQFQNAIQMITTFASGAINTGVTKYTAEYQGDDEQLHKVWRTAGSVAFIGSMVSAVVVIIFSRELAGWFLNEEGYSSVFVWFAATLVLFVFNVLLLSILNGKKEIHRYVIASVVGSLFSLLVVSFMVVQYGLYGALIALAIYQSLSCFVTLILCFNTDWFRLSYMLGGIDIRAAKNLAKYTAMALTSAVCVPVSHILVRNYLGEVLGWEAAGYWEAMWRLSGAYLMLVTTTISVYYLPRLSELTETVHIISEILHGYRVVLPVAALCGFIIFLLRDYIVAVLFSSDFSPMRKLFAWQMVGDTFKIGSWILAYLMLGKAMVKSFIFAEVIFSSCFVVLTYFFTDLFGLEGAAMAHAATYLIYWALMAVLVMFFLRKNDRGYSTNR